LLREPLNARKQKVVDYAFSYLDLEGSGSLRVQNLVQLFDISKNPEGVKKSRDQLLGEFLECFSEGDRADGKITKNEWNTYYVDVAISIPSDDVFVKFVESTWQIADNQHDTAFTDKVKSLLGMTRQRLLMLSNNTEEEFKLRSIFKQFDLNHSGGISILELAAMLAKLGIVVDQKYIEAMHAQIDTNRNGLIDFEEFANLVIYNPYK
jgi:Ca2+-binding EF-hand superfamily protein